MPDSWEFRFELPDTPPKDAKLLTAEELERELLRQLETNKRPEEDILWDLIRVYSWTNRHEKAFAEVQRLVELTESVEKKGGYYLAMGQLMEKMLQFDEAIRYYTQALSLEPVNSHTWYFIHNNLGFCLNHFGKHRDAEFYCRKAIEIEPSRQNAYKNLGVSLEGQGDYSGAAECYFRAIQVNASDARPITHLEALAEKHPEVTVDVRDFDHRFQACKNAIEHARRVWRESLERQGQVEEPEKPVQVAARILCLDDEPAPLHCYKLILKNCGYEVLTTQSSREALDIMSKERIDLLIQDIARPDINGIELYGVMKSDERLRHIPVVICSGYEGNREKFLKQHQDAAAVIAKPIEPKHLIDVVRKALGSAESMQG